VSPDDKTLIALGLIIKPRGLSGEIVVKPFNEDNPSLRRDLPIIIKTKKELLPDKAEYVKKIGNRLMVKFGNVHDRDQAEAIIGGEILARLEDLPQKKENEFYVFQLIGFDAVDADGVIFGKVKDILNMPANDLMLIESSEGEVLVPFIFKFIDDIDLIQKRIKVAKIREFII
jgi:16S rRNA processing protein RimM